MPQSNALLPENTLMARDSMVLVQTVGGRAAWFPRGPACSVDYPSGWPRGAAVPVRPTWFFLPDPIRAAQNERIAALRNRWNR
jgi:hypothetical protein